MTTFNPIPALPEPNGSAARATTAGASAGGAARPAPVADLQRGRPDVDVAQRIARRSAESLPETRQLLESMSQDISVTESIQQAAGVLSDAAKKAPAFDVAGVSVALETIRFALEQGREYAEKLKTSLPSLQAVAELTPDALASNAGNASGNVARLQQESEDMRNRLSTLAEELAGRNRRIENRATAQPLIDNLTSALQSQSRRGLASVGLLPGGQSQVSSLLSDLGMDRGTPVRAPAAAETANAVGTLVSRLQKQFPDVS